MLHKIAYRIFPSLQNKTKKSISDRRLLGVYERGNDAQHTSKQIRYF